MTAAQPTASAEHVLVIGATSGIGRAVCGRLAARGCRLLVAGRNQDELRRIAADLNVRYQSTALTEPFDALDFDSHPAFIDHCISQLDNRLDGVVVCHGYLPDAGESESNFTEARRTIDVNLTSVVSLLTPIVNHLAEQKRGWIAVISSVAGDRGRQSNYIYGCAKGGLSVYLQGLRNRLHQRGIHVLTIKPGFVATAMTDGLLDPDSPLVASAEKVAADIDRAIRRRRNVLYTPWFWRPIMCIIGCIPEWLFKRLKL